MKNSKYVELFGGGKVLVQEVPVRRILTVLPFLKWQKGKEEAGEVKKTSGGRPCAGPPILLEDKNEVQKTFIDHASELLEDTVGLKADDLLDLLPSDLEQIWAAFREVNSFFFATADKLGVTDQVGTILRSVLAGVGSELVTSLKTAIQVVLTTDSASLSAPSAGPTITAETE
jgi:hypothetical protein